MCGPEPHGGFETALWDLVALLFVVLFHEVREVVVGVKTEVDERARFVVPFEIEDKGASLVAVAREERSEEVNGGAQLVAVLGVTAEEVALGCAVLAGHL